MHVIGYRHPDTVGVQEAVQTHSPHAYSHTGCISAHSTKHRPPPRQERGVWPPGGVLCPARLSPATGVFEAGCPAVHGRLRQGEGRPMESSRSYTGTWRCLVGPCWCLHCPPPTWPSSTVPHPHGCLLPSLQAQGTFRGRPSCAPFQSCPSLELWQLLLTYPHPAPLQDELMQPGRGWANHLVAQWVGSGKAAGSM